jgi:hypothetical protein
MEAEILTLSGEHPTIVYFLACANIVNRVSAPRLTGMITSGRLLSLKAARSLRTSTH